MKALEFQPTACVCGCILGKYDAAKEGLLKLGDIVGLLQLNVEEQRWDDAFLLLAAHSHLRDQVYLPYAKWLLSQDRYVQPHCDAQGDTRWPVCNCCCRNTVLLNPNTHRALRQACLALLNGF